MSELIDNRAERIRQLKAIIKDLHAGAPEADVRRRLKEIVRETDSTEIAAMEQELIADGMPVEEVQTMCDSHAAVLKEISVEPAVRDVEPGHPIDTFQRENAAIRELTARLRERLDRCTRLPEHHPIDDELTDLRHGVGELMDVDKHYQRKENLVFPCLERHFIFGPSKVMWAKDDEVRELLKDVERTLKASGVSAGEFALVVETVVLPALEAVDSMVQKEEQVLLPMAHDTLTEREWGEIWLGSAEFGWCLVEPREGYRPPVAAEEKRKARVAPDEALMFPTGGLTPEQLLGIFRMLPVDVTFVDADDRVRFFSEGGDRVFARSKAIIGRKVQHCHPPKSVDVVERIVGDFRAGRQHVAEFWIQLRGRFVHIRYFAVRDEHGEYLGTLEVTQDLTRVRQLDGERRLLEYEASAEVP